LRVPDADVMNQELPAIILAEEAGYSTPSFADTFQTIERGA